MSRKRKSSSVCQQRSCATVRTALFERLIAAMGPRNAIPDLPALTRVLPAMSTTSFSRHYLSMGWPPGSMLARSRRHVRRLSLAGQMRQRLSYSFQSRTNGFHGPLHMRLYCAQRHAGSDGDVLQVHLIQESHDEDGSLFSRQSL
jgi:hypothetical protein